MTGCRQRKITANYGNNSLLQFADFTLGSGDRSGGTGSPDFSIGTGPSVTWNQTANSGWTGARALQFIGGQTGQNAYASYVVYDDLDVVIGEDTQLSYKIFPDFVNEYDYNFPSMYMAVDLQFSDGTCMSDLNVSDQNGNIVTAEAQGDSRALYSRQWNDIYTTDLGTKALGKTVKSIIISFDNPAENVVEFPAYLRTYFDDITIETREVPEYEHLSDYVNIPRGTNDSTGFSRGLTAPLITVPNGFNFYAPATTNSGSKVYNYQTNSNNALRHITVSHEPSYWIGDRGTFQFMANTSANSTTATSSNTSASNRRAGFDHANEIPGAHYYSVTTNAGDANANGVTIEVTPTSHATYARFTFPEGSANRSVIFDSVNNASNSSIEFSEDGKSFSGYTTHTSNGMARMYVYGEFDTAGDTNVITQAAARGIISFAAAASGDTVVTMKMATSFISLDQAKKNLALEISDSDTFDTIKAAAQKLWDEKLNIIEIEGASYEQMVTFYSNMYRHYNDQGWVPRWVAPGGTNSMVGTSSDVIFANAVMSYQVFDVQNAYLSALRNSAVVSTSSVNGQKSQNSASFLGYTPNNEGEGMSWSIESYINDYGIARMAHVMMDSLEDRDSAEYQKLYDEYIYYSNRAKNYVKLFNSDIGNGWFMGRDKSGNWTRAAETFDPTYWGGDYTETDAYNMLVSITYDGQGLANLYGGRDKLEAVIDSIFDTPGDFNVGGYGGTIHEMLEARETKMGQYGHNNQPSHHIPYMYLYAGAPYKTQEKVRDVLDRLYVSGSFGQGYSGDEDNGEMSAWYIFSALGIYPVDMGSGQYVIGSPLFAKATVHLENGEELVISAPNNSRENIYIQSMTFNGESYNKIYFDYSDLANGGSIVFNMGSTPSAWGTDEAALPPSMTEGDEVAKPLNDLLSSSPIMLSEAARNNLQYPGVYISGDYSSSATLFDNDSNNITTFDGAAATIQFCYPSQRTVSFYTITSGTDTEAAPSSWTIWGSNNNRDWVKLDERTEQEFMWSKYTRPFALETEVSYQNYRLDIAAVSGAENLEIAELELMGVAQDYSSKEALAELISIAEAIDPDQYATSSIETLSNDLEAARAVYNDLTASPAEILAAANALDGAIGGLIKVRSGHGLIEAESFNTASSGINGESTTLTDGTVIGNIGGTTPGGWMAFLGLDFDVILISD